MRCEAVGRILSGASVPEEEGPPGALKEHAAGCLACREGIVRFLEEEALLGREIGPAVAGRLLHAAAGRRPRFRRAPLWTAAAAAAVLAVGIWAMRSGKAPARAFALPEGRSVAADGETVRPTASAPESLGLPDGSRFRIAPGSEARFARPEGTTRCRIELTRGMLEAEVVKGGGAVVVASEAGEIRVVGTSFTARAFRVHPAGRESFPVLAVEVSIGAVDLAGAQGRTERVVAGRRGIARPGGLMVQEAVPMAWQEALARWGRGARDPGFPETGACFTLLAGSWSGIGNWAEVASRAEATAQERQVAALLARLTGDTGETE